MPTSQSRARADELDQVSVGGASARAARDGRSVRGKVRPARAGAVLLMAAGAALGLSGLMGVTAHAATDDDGPEPAEMTEAAEIASAQPAGTDGDEPARGDDAGAGAMADDGPGGADGGAGAAAGDADDSTVLAFKNVTVDAIVPFLVEATGKVVMPQAEVLTRRITILNNRPIPRREALDLVVLALQESGIAVVETERTVKLRDIAEIDRMGVPVVGSDRRLAGRTDMGTIVQKVFRLQHGVVANLAEQLKPEVPTWAKLGIDPDSNQVFVTANVGTLQKIEALLDQLDTPATDTLESTTFMLRYADAAQIAQNIKDLYTNSTTSGQNQNRQNQNPFQFFRGGGGGNNQNQGDRNRSNQREPGGVFTSTNLRVTANTQQNSVTVLAEKPIIDQIRRQIGEEWDRPLAQETVVPKVYQLEHSDPVKVKELLTNIYGNPGQSQQGGGGGGGGNNNQQASQNQQTANRLFGQFSFEAIPEAGRLVVIAKSPEHIRFIDEIIAQIDRPQTAGLPQIVELKHAQAEELSEQLNALLSQEGTLAQISRSESGLTDSQTAASPFATSNTQQNGTTGGQQNQQGGQQTSPGTITFWWQRARVPTNTAGASNLVSKIRIVPVWRQNALMVLSPPEYHSTLVSVIQELDRPGRQVLLSAVIAEITLDDETAIGLRWSSQSITPNNADNSFGIGAPPNQQSFTGVKNDLLPDLFDTSVLNVGANLNILLQALNEKTSINILSEPRIFTSDNQEAEFFNGQDIPFITDSQTNTVGNLVQSFDYRAVGIALRVRPRITINRDVDLRINLELSSIQPNQTLFGGFIVDRRETTTQLIVKDGQTVVVSGIMRTQDQDVNRKVPLLGDIPLVGEIFKSTERVKSKTELVAFITPFVINNTTETDDLTKPDRERLGELRDLLRPEDKALKAEDLEKGGTGAGTGTGTGTGAGTGTGSGSGRSGTRRRDPTSD